MNQVEPSRGSKASFTEGSIKRHVLHLSTVMILGFFAMTAGGLLEMFYIGMVGKLELAAITFMFPISMSLLSLTRGIGVGASSLIAQSMGQGDRRATAVTITHCYLLVVLFTVTIVLLGQLGTQHVFSLLGARGEVLGLVTGYAGIWLLGFPLMGIAMVSTGLIRAFGNVNLPGVIMAAAPIVQVVVGPFLIFGLLGFPEMGLKGAAFAFICGASIQVVLIAYWYFIRERLFVGSLEDFLLSARQILHVGIPAAATNLIHPLSAAVVTWLLAGYGASVVAGFGVASRIESVVGMVVIGISTGVVPLVGQNWGARKFERAYEAIRTCYIACLLWGLVAASIMWVFGAWFVSVINDDPALMETAVTFLHIIPFSIGFMGLITVSTHAFNALRKPMPALILSITRLIIFYIPMALVASHFYGYVGVFAATAITNVVIGIIAVYWNHKTLKREEALIA